MGGYPLIHCHVASSYDYVPQKGGRGSNHYFFFLFGNSQTPKAGWGKPYLTPGM